MDEATFSLFAFENESKSLIFETRAIFVLMHLLFLPKLFYIFSLFKITRNPLYKRPLPPAIKTKVYS